jgi:plastocyanin
LKLVLLAALALGFLAACDKTGTGNTCASTGAVTIDLKDDSTYVPASLTITPTQKVCWQNLGRLTHTMTSDVVLDSIDITLPPDFTFTQGFGTVQDFNYHCRFHPGMVGSVHVR